MQFAECVMQRYATKKFDGRTIPEAKVNELLELVRFAPSALNLQPWKIKVIDGQGNKRGASPGVERPGADHDLFAPARLLRRCGLRQPDQKARGADEENHVPAEIIKMVTGMAARFVAGMSPEQRAAWSQAQTYPCAG